MVDLRQIDRAKPRKALGKTYVFLAAFLILLISSLLAVAFVLCDEYLRGNRRFDGGYVFLVITLCITAIFLVWRPPLYYWNDNSEEPPGSR